MPLLRTNGGGGVALANRAAALNVPVDCNAQNIVRQIRSARFQVAVLSMLLENHMVVMEMLRHLQPFAHLPICVFQCFLKQIRVGVYKCSVA